MRVEFDEVGSGLTVGSAPWLPKDAAPLPADHLTGFAIAGEEKKWVEAEARIEGGSVVVSVPADRKTGRRPLRVG